MNAQHAPVLTNGRRLRLNVDCSTLGVGRVELRNGENCLWLASAYPTAIRRPESNRRVRELQEQLDHFRTGPACCASLPVPLR